jgi:hypothetical protein
MKISRQMNGTIKSIAADNGSSAKPNACHARPMGSQSRNTRNGCSPKLSRRNEEITIAQPMIHDSPMPPIAIPALSFLLRCAHNTISTKAANGRNGRMGSRLKMVGVSCMENLVHVLRATCYVLRATWYVTPLPERKTPGPEITHYALRITHHASRITITPSSNQVLRR